MKIYKIAVTGGPCALKTKSIQAIEKHLREKYSLPVFFLEETATDLIKNIIHPNDYKDSRNFQPLVFEYQVSKEQELREKIVNNYNFYQCVVICDRGILDNKAYLPCQKDFDKILDEYNYSEIKILDSYDLVIDLISTANSEYGNYGKDNNKERFENDEFAKKLDIKTTNAWVAHRNLEIVDCKPTEEEKINNILKIIDSYFGEREVKIQNSYKIDTSSSDFSIYNDDNSKLINIEEYELNNPFNGNYTFIRRSYKGEDSYLMHFTENIKGKDRVIFDGPITRTAFCRLVRKERCDLLSKKRRLTFANDKKIYNIDFYSNNEAYLVIDGDINDYDLPSYIKLSDKKNIEKSNKILKKTL